MAAINLLGFLLLLSDLSAEPCSTLLSQGETLVREDFAGAVGSKQARSMASCSSGGDDFCGFPSRPAYLLYRLLPFS
jgi:hypothetical protein